MLVLHINFVNKGKFEKGTERISYAISKERRNRIKTLGVEFTYDGKVRSYTLLHHPNLSNLRWWSCPTAEDVHQILQIFPALERLVFIPYTSVRPKGSHSFRTKLRFVDPDFTTEPWSHMKGWNAAVTALLTTHYLVMLRYPRLSLWSWVLKVGRRNGILMK